MKKFIEESMNYGVYMDLIERLVNEGKTSGPEQTEALSAFTRLNLQRHKRLAKTIVVADDVKDTIAKNSRPMYWLIISESWCGDGAQNIPVIEKIAAENVNIETRHILRDEHPDLMDRFLNEGARSIPKLIALDRDTLEVLGTWGSRPKAAQAYFEELKQQGMEKDLIKEMLQRWYNEDKGRSLQAEFAELLGQWEGGRTSHAGA